VCPAGQPSKALPQLQMSVGWHNPHQRSGLNLVRMPDLYNKAQGSNLCSRGDDEKHHHAPPSGGLTPTLVKHCHNKHVNGMPQQ
jgi:hypothetical protein